MGKPGVHFFEASGLSYPAGLCPNRISVGVIPHDPPVSEAIFVVLDVATAQTWCRQSPPYLRMGPLLEATEAGLRHGVLPRFLSQVAVLLGSGSEIEDEEMLAQVFSFIQVETVVVVCCCGFDD